MLLPKLLPSCEEPYLLNDVVAIQIPPQSIPNVNENLPEINF